ncbi:MAG: peptidoglycan DD-metalloendopeptidase family protein [Planctomycetes bacterium]|nr:peptidoglycan DD-metalloendopeptidase family protein [Planctomycetota bacterium]
MGTGMRLLAAAVLAVLALGTAVPAEASGEFVYPVSGRLTSTYYSSRPYGIHAALDIAASSWTPIGAARRGQVSFAGWSGGYGNLVILDHGNGYQTYYAHQVNISISRGRWVAAGERIGYVGSTGNSTGPHVHFEVRRNGSKQYLPGSSGNWVTKGNAIPYTYPGLGGDAPPPPGPVASVKVIEVTTSALNVRTGPSTGYGIQGTIGSGQRYVRIATSGSWQKIWYNAGTAWVHGGYTRTLSGAPARRVTASGLNVRTGPSTGYGSVGVAPSGSYYAEVGTSGAWVKIWFAGNLRWFHGGYTARVTP